MRSKDFNRAISLKNLLLFIGVPGIAFIIYFGIYLFFPVAKIAVALYSVKGFTFAFREMDGYISLFMAKRAPELLKVLGSYRGFVFKDEDIPLYIQLSYLPSGPEIMRGLREFYEDPPLPRSLEEMKDLAMFARIRRPDEILTMLKKAGFVILNGRLSSFDPYFLTHVSKDENARNLLKDRIQMEKYILKELNGRSHIFPANAGHSEGPDEIKRLNPIQLLKVYTALEALGDRSFTKSIGEEIIKDMEDKSCEYGGIILFDERGRLKIKVYPSEAKGDNGFYQPPEEARRSKKFCDFHIHARSEDESLFAGPSDILGGDLSIPVRYAAAGLPYTAMVFTKLPGRNFNADIYFANSEDPLSPVVVDLGNYSY